MGIGVFSLTVTFILGVVFSGILVNRIRRTTPSNIIIKSNLEVSTNVTVEDEPKAIPKKPPKSKVGFLDTLRVGVSGIKTRKLRSALSALGITIGIAALIGVLGLSASGSADLMKSLDALGTNLLTIRAGEGFGQNQSELPSLSLIHI